MTKVGISFIAVTLLNSIKLQHDYISYLSWFQLSPPGGPGGPLIERSRVGSPVYIAAGIIMTWYLYSWSKTISYNLSPKCPLFKRSTE